MTFIVKTRGDRGTMVAEYRCPFHGVFATRVQRDDAGDAPNEQPCPALFEPDRPDLDGVPCEFPSLWTPSTPAIHTQFVVSATQGKSDPKPHRMSMDTRPLAEGQRFHDWKKERKKLWEEKRHERVKELLK